MKCLSLKWIICILRFLFTLIFWCNYCLRRLVWKCSITHLRAFILKYYTQVRLKYIFSNSHLMCCANNYFMWPFRENIFRDFYSHPIKKKGILNSLHTFQNISQWQAKILFMLPCRMTSRSQTLQLATEWCMRCYKNNTTIVIKDVIYETWNMNQPILYSQAKNRPVFLSFS